MSFVARRSLTRVLWSVGPLTCIVLLCSDDIWPVFCDLRILSWSLYQMTIGRFSVFRRLYASVFRRQVCWDQEAFDKSSVVKRSLTGLLRSVSLWHFICGQKTGILGQKAFEWPSVIKRPLTDLLWSEDLWKVFCGQKTFDRTSVVRRPLTGLLWSKDNWLLICGLITFGKFSVFRRPRRGHLWSTRDLT